MFEFQETEKPRHRVASMSLRIRFRARGVLTDCDVGVRKVLRSQLAEQLDSEVVGDAVDGHAAIVVMGA